MSSLLLLDLPKLPPTSDTIGALLVGWGISSLVLGVVYVQGWIYFARYPNDGVYYKLLVAVLLIFETLHQAMVGHSTWHYDVANFGNVLTYLQPPVWSLSVQVVLGAFVGTIVKICYGMRVWKFSKGNIFVTALIMISTATQLGFALAFSIRSFNTILVNAGQLTALGTASLALGAATDLLTACSLSFFLHRLRTGYKGSDTLINRLIAHSVNTGMLTSLVSLTVVTVYNAKPMSFIFMAVYFVLAKLYTISCLATLNSRRFVSGRGTDNEMSPSPASALALSPHSASRAKHQTRSNPLRVDIHHEVSIVSEQGREALKHQASQHSTVSREPQAYYSTGW